MTESSGVAVQYSLPNSLPEWELPEVPVPESPEHDEIADRLRQLLVAWLARTGLPGAVRRNLAIRWVESQPRVGVDPDVCYIDAVPHGWDEGEIDSLMTWRPGHRVPKLAIEIVSRSHPYKDYGVVQDKYAALGVEELWVYDPRKFGPTRTGGPVLLQLWQSNSSGVLVRRHFADTPVRSPLLGAWLLPQTGGHLVIADHPLGEGTWLTLHQDAANRAEQEAGRADAEELRALAEKDRADAEKKRAGAERARADAEKKRADAERARADGLQKELERLRATSEPGE